MTVFPKRERLLQTTSCTTEMMEHTVNTEFYFVPNHEKNDSPYVVLF